MAEFVEVTKQRKRMCKKAKACDYCPISMYNNGKNLNCPTFIEKHPDIAESIILKWAKEHPEPRYPTWHEWWKENFSGSGTKMITPCSFASPRELGCSSLSGECMNAPYKCWHKPIPAHIAEKLGIKPIEEGD